MTWILTRSGKRFELFNPTAAMIDPLDIAHSLSMQCRFNGHTSGFYSVAEHCLLVAELVPEQHQLAALLHDAAEAYIGDLVSPLKHTQREYYEGHQLISFYDEIERRIWLAICERFNLEPELPPCIHDADLVALATEKRDLMPAHPDPWDCLIGTQPRAKRIERPLPPSQASLYYFNKLMELLSTHHRKQSAA